MNNLIKDFYSKKVFKRLEHNQPYEARLIAVNLTELTSSLRVEFKFEFEKGHFESEYRTINKNGDYSEFFIQLLIQNSGEEQNIPSGASRKAIIEKHLINKVYTLYPIYSTNETEDKTYRNRSFWFQPKPETTEEEAFEEIKEEEVAPF